jgi:hypothetical protein
MQTAGRRHAVRAAILEEFVGPPQLPMLPRSPGDAPALVGGHARPPPSISAVTTQQPSHSVPMPSWHATRVTTPKRSPVSWIVSSHPSRSRQLTPRGQLEEAAGDSPASRGGRTGRSARSTELLSSLSASARSSGRHRHPGNRGIPPEVLPASAPGGGEAAVPATGTAVPAGCCAWVPARTSVGPPGFSGSLLLCGQFRG